MTNFLVLLVIGAALGWLATAARRAFGQGEMLVNLIGGAAGSFTLGLTANGKGLYAGLSGAGYAGAVAGAIAALGLLALARRWRPR
jgi:hypothetical protein